MITYMILRGVIFTYSVGVVLLVAKALSSVIFANSDNRKAELSTLPGRLGTAFIWPLTLLSKSGLRKINKQIDK